jgi:hypothetical protein
MVRPQYTADSEVPMSPNMVMFYFIVINLKYIHKVTMKSFWTINCISMALLFNISEIIFIWS